MNDFKTISVGIRSSELSKAQTNMFLSELNKVSSIRQSHTFEIKTIKTSGDIYSDQRLDKIGGKGLFIKEIEKEIISGSVDIGVHSLKDLPAVENNEELEIICWLKRYDAHDALISSSGKRISDLPTGSIVGTSSIRRRSQVLKVRKDLNIKLLRGNVDTRIDKLNQKQYDAIILSLAGLQRLKKDKLVTEVLDYENFLPAASQGAVAIQAKKKSNLKSLFMDLNDKNTQIECSAERRILKLIKANCNSPVSVYAKIVNDNMNIHFQILDHDGKLLFKKNIVSNKSDYKNACSSLARDIIEKVGQKKIDELDKLDDFNYTP